MRFEFEFEYTSSIVRQLAQLVRPSSLVSLLAIGLLDGLEVVVVVVVVVVVGVLVALAGGPVVVLRLARRDPLHFHFPKVNPVVALHLVAVLRATTTVTTSTLPLYY